MSAWKASARSRGSAGFLLVACAFAAGCSSASGKGAPDHGDAAAVESGGGSEARDGQAPTAEAGSATSHDAGPGEGGGPADGGNAGQACTDYVTAFCSRYETCSPYWFGRQYGDDATCRARNLIGCAGQFTANGATWTSAGLEACAASIPTAKCEDLILLGRLPPSCTPSPGTLADGAGCAFDSQCAGRVCLFGDFGSCGACATISPAGAICVDSTECASGMVCAGSSSPGACTPYVLEGGSCSDAPCAPWLSCQNGTCGKPEQVGGACSSNPDAFDPCDTFAGILCDNVSMMCIAPVVDTTNQSCADHSICAASYVCTTSGGCAPPIKEGDDCAVLSGPACLPPSRCDNGLCTLPDPVRCSSTSLDGGRD